MGKVHTLQLFVVFLFSFLAHSALKMNLIQHFKIKSKYWSFIAILELNLELNRLIFSEFWGQFSRD